MNVGSRDEGGLIQRVIRFSAENRFLVLVLYAIVIVLAVGVIRRTPLDAIPDLSDTQVNVYSRWDRVLCERFKWGIKNPSYYRDENRVHS